MLLAPSSAFSTLAKETKDPENYSEIRLEKKEKGQDPTVIIGNVYLLKLNFSWFLLYLLGLKFDEFY